jgi:hypothetical protein
MNLKLLPVALLCLGAAGCVRQPAGPSSGTAFVFADPPLTAENYDRIRVGMTLAEVEAVLGPPTATGNRDVTTPEGAVRKQVESASWVKFVVPPGPGRRAASAGGEAHRGRVRKRHSEGEISGRGQIIAAAALPREPQRQLGAM